MSGVASGRLAGRRRPARPYLFTCVGDAVNHTAREDSQRAGLPTAAGGGRRSGHPAARVADSAGVARLSWRRSSPSFLAGHWLRNPGEPIASPASRRPRTQDGPGGAATPPGPSSPASGQTPGAKATKNAASADEEGGHRRRSPGSLLRTRPRRAARRPPTAPWPSLRRKDHPPPGVLWFPSSSAPRSSLSRPSLCSTRRIGFARSRRRERVFREISPGAPGWCAGSRCAWAFAPACTRERPPRGLQQHLGGRFA